MFLFVLRCQPAELLSVVAGAKCQTPKTHRHQHPGASHLAVTPIQASQPCSCRTSQLADTNAGMEGSFAISFNHPAAVSTPVNQSFNTPDPAAMRRIHDLEGELEKLRQQIAMVVMSQQQNSMVAPTQGTNATGKVDIKH